MEPKYHTIFQAVIIALALTALSQSIPKHVPASHPEQELHADNGTPPRDRATPH
jgi:hypothetical protein